MIRKQSFVFIKNTYLSSSKECEDGDMLLFYIYFFFIKVSLFFCQNMKISKTQHNIIYNNNIIIRGIFYSGWHSIIILGIVWPKEKKTNQIHLIIKHVHIRSGVAKPGRAVQPREVSKTGNSDFFPAGHCGCIVIIDPKICY